MFAVIALSLELILLTKAFSFKKTASNHSTLLSLSETVALPTHWNIL